MKRFEVFDSGDDRVMSVDLKTKEIKDELVLPQSFYSQQRGVALSNEIFGIKYVGDQIESI